MENAQLISLSRQIALQRQMDVVANNLANINTTGFKAEQLVFEEYRMPVARDMNFPAPDQTLSYVQDWATVHDMSPGALTQTGNPFDVAIEGNGFLAVDTPAGERWTRSGSLQLDANGQLVDTSGNPVLTDTGPISFQSSETDIVITNTGDIMSSAGKRGRLKIVEFASPEDVIRQGDNLYAGGTPLPATSTRLHQGMTERSNVSGVAEMSSMIRVTRAYQSLASLMEQQDQLRRSAIQRLGELSA